MLEKCFETKDKFGSLVLYRDVKKGLFLVEPKGIINPSLIKTDLKEAYTFGESLQREWIYIVNTKNVKFPNPLNLLCLSKIKKLPYMKEYIIYAPSMIVRFLGRLTSFIIKPDIVLNEEKQFQELIK